MFADLFAVMANLRTVIKRFDIKLLWKQIVIIQYHYLLWNKTIIIMGLVYNLNLNVT